MNQHRRLYFSIFILLAFLLALFVSQNSSIRWVDAQMFRLASHLLPRQAPSNDLRFILLDESELQTPEGIQSFRFMLRKLRKAGAAQLAWLSDDFPRMDYQQKKQDESTALENLDNEEKQTLWEPTQGERNKLAWMLENQSVFLTQYNNAPHKMSALRYREDLFYQQGWRQFIPTVFLPQQQYYRELNTQFPYRVYPFNNRASAEQTLVWYSENIQQSLPDLSLAIYSAFLKTQQLSWDERGYINMDNSVIKVNSSGKVYNYFSQLTQRHVPLPVLNLETAATKNALYFRNKIVLISQDKQQLQILADAISSLQANAHYHIPAMNWWILPLVLLSVMAYLLLLLPLLSRQSGLFLGAFLSLSIVTAQPISLILFANWWPSVSVLLLMLLGHMAVYVYLSGDEILQNLIKEQHYAWFKLGHYQYEKGDYEAAIGHLLKCQPADDVLADLYEIGLSFERKRQYDRALQVYSEIHLRNTQFKDIAKRMKSLSGFSETRTEVMTPGQMQKTLVLPEMELPEFGRYKIEKELGRGAMGVVYLGKDPKINRQVAIKTLDYTQFADKELATVKSRFFREAEAAGRLSHSHIVTVYDVGEEEGLAFIAMDYVSGVPLSNYTKKDKLLPLHEVYRIVQVVAEALDYAHQQKIVHRDIKPGNIMYNPEDQQIKITDFGIARITDSVKTRTGSFMGSPSYMAPEQMTGAHVDGQADLYALGVSFYQLLTGSLPFDADSIGNLAYKITNEKHRPVRELRPELPASATRIINKALQKQPDKRFSSGAEMANALRKGMPEMSS